MFRLGWLFRYNRWESDALKNHPNLFIPDHSIYFEYKLHKKEKWRIGGKEEKKLLDNHSYSIKRLDSMKVELNKMIRDYGYLYNSYISEA